MLLLSSADFFFKINLFKKLFQGQGWKILKISTRPTSPYVLVNSIIYVENSQNFYSSCSMRHSPCRADEWIFPALRGTFSVSNRLDPVHNVCPDLGPNCLQRLSADDKSCL